MAGLGTPGEEISISSLIGHNTAKKEVSQEWLDALEPIKHLEKIHQVRIGSDPSFLASVLLEVRGRLSRDIHQIDLNNAGSFEKISEILRCIQVYNNLPFLSQLKITQIDISQLTVVSQIYKIGDLIADIVEPDFKVGGTSVE